MKKIILYILITAVILTIGITAYGSFEKMRVEKIVEKTEIETINILDKAFENRDMEELLRKKGLYEDEIRKNMTSYLECIVDYNISSDVNKILLDGVEEGKDLDKLIKIYQFLFMANKDYTIIDDMYNIGEMTNFKNKYWVEDAYNQAADNPGGVLNKEEITEYLNKDLTHGDIAIANTLCFKGVKKIDEILDERVNKIEWIDIIASIYPEINIDKNVFCEVEPYEILDYIRTTLAHSENINEMYNKKEMKLTEIAQKQLEKRNEILNNKITDENVRFVLDDTMKTYAENKLPRLNTEQIETLMKDGYLIREIERGIKISEERGISIKDAIDKDYKGGRNK